MRLRLFFSVWQYNHLVSSKRDADVKVLFGVGRRTNELTLFTFPSDVTFEWESTEWRAHYGIKKRRSIRNQTSRNPLAIRLFPSSLTYSNPPFAIRESLNPRWLQQRFSTCFSSSALFVMAKYTLRPPIPFALLPVSHAVSHRLFLILISHSLSLFFYCAVLLFNSWHALLSWLSVLFTPLFGRLEVKFEFVWHTECGWTRKNPLPRPKDRKKPSVYLGETTGNEESTVRRF